MSKLTYRIDVHSGRGGYTVRIPALPGCMICGGTYEQAVAAARFVLESCLARLASQHQPIPIEHPESGMPVLTVSAPLPVIV